MYNIVKNKDKKMSYHLNKYLIKLPLVSFENLLLLTSHLANGKKIRYMCLCNVATAIYLKKLNIYLIYFTIKSS